MKEFFDDYLVKNGYSWSEATQYTTYILLGIKFPKEVNNLYKEWEKQYYKNKKGGKNEF